jgi:hypothetical protein
MIIKKDRTLKGIRPKNVVYHEHVRLYSSSLGAIHLGYHWTQEEAAELVKQVTELYKAKLPYVHLIQPINSKTWARLYA